VTPARPSREHPAEAPKPRRARAWVLVAASTVAGVLGVGGGSALDRYRGRAAETCSCADLDERLRVQEEIERKRKQDAEMREAILQELERVWGGKAPPKRPPHAP